MSEPLDEKLYGGLGLAQLKTEGEPFVYDPGAGPGVPLTPWQQRLYRLRQFGDRLRRTPGRLWWAVFGDEYY